MKVSRLVFPLVFIVYLVPAVFAQAQNVPAEYREVLTILGKQGDYASNVLKVNIPRNDLNVSVQGLPVPTALGFGGWVAMTNGADGKTVMMGDLVLVEKEVNPVMSALLNNGIEVTALHNHFFFEQPRIFYMHVMGMENKPADLAQKVKPALDLIGQGAKAETGSTNAKPSIDTSRLVQVIGHNGEANGAVYKITVGRDDINLREMGAVINARMGLNTWAAFIGTDDKASVAGDVAMLPGEVTPVLKTLRSHGIDVVSIHNHMIGTKPEIIFLHYWGQGTAAQLATGFKAVLDQLGKKQSISQTQH
jgi:Domain of Unknown Function (DUF1259)